MAGIAAAVALAAVLVWLWRTAGMPGLLPEREVRHDNVTAWLTCHSFLRDSVPDATLGTSPWRASQDNVRRIEETTYWAAGTAAIQGDDGRAAEFECVVEWAGGGWRLTSLNAVVVPVAR